MTGISRCTGALLGLATGDALGTTLEFRAPGSFTPISDMEGGGPFGLAPGMWTDDTSMALCLAESLAERGGFDARDQMDRYVRWWREGHWSATGTCFGIGNATRTALTRYVETSTPMAGTTDPRVAGNGSLMRLAPVPIYWRHDPAATVLHAGESSRTTHGAQTCVDACRYYAALIRAALDGVPRDAFLAAGFFPDPLHPEIAEIAAGSFRAREPPQIQGSGYVVRSLEAALWAFHNSQDFRQGAILAVNLGDDADTTGAIYGQLAGAFYGEEAIPATWRTRVHRHDEIRALARRLALHG